MIPFGALLAGAPGGFEDALNKARQAEQQRRQRMARTAAMAGPNMGALYGGPPGTTAPPQTEAGAPPPDEGTPPAISSDIPPQYPGMPMPGPSGGPLPGTQPMMPPQFAGSVQRPPMSAQGPMAGLTMQPPGQPGGQNLMAGAGGMAPQGPQGAPGGMAPPGPQGAPAPAPPPQQMAQRAPAPAAPSPAPAPTRVPSQMDMMRSLYNANPAHYQGKGAEARLRQDANARIKELNAQVKKAEAAVPSPDLERRGWTQDRLNAAGQYLIKNGRLPPEISSLPARVKDGTGAYKSALVDAVGKAASALGGGEMRLGTLQLQREGQFLNKFGQSLTSLGTVEDHAEALRKAANEWHKVEGGEDKQWIDIPVVNSTINTLSQTLGFKGAVGLETVGEAVGIEMVKALNGRAATLEERRYWGQRFGNAGASLKQFDEVMKEVDALLGGQFNSLSNTYSGYIMESKERAYQRFRGMLTERAAQAADQVKADIQKQFGGSALGLPKGWSIEGQ